MTLSLVIHFFSFVMLNFAPGKTFFKEFILEQFFEFITGDEELLRVKQESMWPKTNFLRFPIKKKKIRKFEIDY